jgi:hypothetical protein
MDTHRCVCKEHGICFSNYFHYCMCKTYKTCRSTKYHDCSCNQNTALCRGWWHVCSCYLDVTTCKVSNHKCVCLLSHRCDCRATNHIHECDSKVSCWDTTQCIDCGVRVPKHPQPHGKRHPKNGCWYGMNKKERRQWSNYKNLYMQTRYKQVIDTSGLFPVSSIVSSYL